MGFIPPPPTVPASAQPVPLVIRNGEVWTIATDEQGDYITEIDIRVGGEIAVAAGAEIAQGVAA